MGMAVAHAAEAQESGGSLQLAQEPPAVRAHPPPSNPSDTLKPWPYDPRSETLTVISLTVHRVTASGPNMDESWVPDPACNTRSLASGNLEHHCCWLPVQ
eukprot:1196272-Prorocentrum_minimum.AAC.3